jgi:dipeptidyl aminopeptidase/acylaminoacyl peptidase
VLGKDAGIVVGSLDSTESTPLISADSQALYAPPGYLLFVRQGTLMGQPFDAERLQVTGDAFPIAESVATDAGNGLSAFSASETGVLTFRAGTIAGTDAALMQLDWVDRQGRAIGQLGPADVYRGLEISPDGARVAVHRQDDTGGDIWVLDVARGVRTRLTFNPTQDNRSPIWSVDGSRIVFASRRNSSWGLFQKPFDSSGTDDELVLDSSTGSSPTSWSPDGRFFVYTRNSPHTSADIWLQPLTGDRKPVAFAQEPFVEAVGRVSPDGKWIAYQSSETGRQEIYVRPFPSGPGKQTISSGAGVQPRWRRDGKELFYIDLDGRQTGALVEQYRVLSVAVNPADAAFRAGVPSLLFTTPMISGTGTGTPFVTYDVSSDGQRFLITRPPTAQAAARPAPEAITVVLNWVEALRK